MLLLGRDQTPSTIRCIHKYKYNPQVKSLRYTCFSYITAYRSRHLTDQVKDIHTFHASQLMDIDSIHASEVTAIRSGKKFAHNLSEPLEISVPR
jgi:hypothetical protein